MENRFPQLFGDHPGAICVPIWTRILWDRSLPELVAQEQTIIHLSPKLRGLTKFQFDKLNVVPELGLITAMRTVFGIEPHEEWPPPPMTYHANPPYPSC